MKNSIKTILGAFFIALIFSFVGCADGSSSGGAADAAAKKAEAAKIVVNIDGTARTLGPSAADLSYRLVVTNGYTKLEEDVTGSTITKELDAGSWTVGVWAYTGDDLGVGWVSKSVTLVEGETKNISLVVLPLTDEEAAGTFSWELTLPDGTESEYTWASGTLTPSYPNSANESIDLGNFSEYNESWTNISGSLELPAGKYSLEAIAYSNREINDANLKAVRKEIVYIYPHLTTEGVLAFTAADFSAEVYFRGTASLNYNYEPDADDSYTPTEVELQLADGTVKIASITLQTNWPGEEEYAWELDTPSNAISTYLTSAQFRFKATAGTKSIYSPWQSFSLSDITGNTNVDLSASVYKINVPAHTGGTVTVNPEAAGGGLARLTVTPAANYGFDATSVTLPSATIVDGTDGLQYDFTMPYSDIDVIVNFFQLTGTVVLSGDNTTSLYKPVKVEAFEEAAGYEWKVIAETTTFGAANDDYPWTIEPAKYVYTNNGSTTSGQKNVIFRVTLESGDKSISYAYSVKNAISNLYGTGTATVIIPINTLSNVYTTTQSDTSIQLFWDHAAWAVGGYNVYRSTSEYGAYSKVNDTPIPLNTTSEQATYEDVGLITAYGYYYYVKGILSGGTEGEESRVGYLAKTKYQTPTNVTATFQQNSARNYVSWSAVPYGQNSYTRYYDVYRNGEYIDYTTSTYYYDNSDVQFNTIYTYTVIARGTDGDNSAESAPSGSVFTPNITDIPLNAYTQQYISAGEYQYFRVNDAQNYSYRYFNLSWTDADIYVQGGSYSSFPYNSNSYSSGYSGSFSIKGYYDIGPLIIVVYGNGSSGNYAFSVQN
ncbi:MAG: hypothetical protein LBG05_05690 [Treponema sp.]|nr:hypothetical protein [Treponema sp.]